MPIHPYVLFIFVTYKCKSTRHIAKNIILIIAGCTCRMGLGFENAHHNNHLFLLTIPTLGCKHSEQYVHMLHEIWYLHFDAFNIDLHLMHKQNWMRIHATVSCQKNFAICLFALWAGAHCKHFCIFEQHFAGLNSFVVRFEFFFKTVWSCNNSAAMVIVTRRHTCAIFWQLRICWKINMYVN